MRPHSAVSSSLPPVVSPETCAPPSLADGQSGSPRPVSAAKGSKGPKRERVGCSVGPLATAQEQGTGPGPDALAAHVSRDDAVGHDGGVLMVIAKTFSVCVKYLVFGKEVMRNKCWTSRVLRCGYRTFELQYTWREYRIFFTYS